MVGVNICVILIIFVTKYSSVFSLDVVILKAWEYTGKSTTLWLTENKPFFIYFESVNKLQDVVTCVNDHGSTIILNEAKAPKGSTTYVYLSYGITASQDMNGRWTCSAYNRGFTAYLGSLIEIPSVTVVFDLIIDVDECNALQPCSIKANCTNTLGSYECTCLPGFEGNGIYCQEIDECAGYSSGPCSPYANCTNTVGSYNCACLSGYDGNGLHCQDVDECNALRPCSTNANCTNTLGSYECTCLPGYEGDGVNCQVLDEGIDVKLLGTIVVAVVVVAVAAWLMLGLYKRRQRREKAIQSNLIYENLEDIIERAMPTPAQWDNYLPPVDRQNENDTDTYSVPHQERNIEEIMYAKPQPKALRKTPNELFCAELSLASVEQKDENSTYGNLSHQNAEHSQIQPKTLIGNPNTSKVSPTEGPYTQVLPKSMRPNKESSNYVNVLDNQRYINSDIGEPSRDRSEYAEPAYCEIGYKK